MIKAVIFDCFGVLLTDALQKICDDLQATNPEAVHEIRELVRYANSGLGDPETSSARVAELLGTTYEGYVQQIRDGEVKNQVLLDYIVGLRKDYKTAMLSNIGRGSLAKRFTKVELTNLFDTVVASGDIGFAKPEPQAYEITAERLGVRLDECVFTDDRELFCEGAQGVGMKAIVYTDFAQFKRALEDLLAANT